MVSSGWSSLYPVISELINDPKKFDFVQALRLLELINAVGKRSSAIQISYSGEQDNIIQARFVSDYRLRFPVAALTSSKRVNENIIQFTVSGFGYVGAIGVLPYSYSYLVSMTQSSKSYGLKHFIDIFQNRSVEFFYRASSKYQITVSYDRGLLGDIDKFKKTIESIVGFSFKNVQNRLRIPDEHILYYSGFFSSFQKTIYALEIMISDELGVNAHVIPYSGRWVGLDIYNRTFLSNINEDSSAYNCLGQTAVVGERVWSTQNHFRVVIGPIESDRIYSILPSGNDQKMIKDIIETYCGVEYEYEIQVIVEAKSVPFCCLYAGDEQDKQYRLGQNTWLLATESCIDRDDIRYSAQDY
jgi:type VI secretion system protein ImpH